MVQAWLHMLIWVFSRWNHSLPPSLLRMELLFQLMQPCFLLPRFWRECGRIVVGCSSIYIELWNPILRIVQLLRRQDRKKHKTSFFRQTVHLMSIQKIRVWDIKWRILAQTRSWTIPLCVLEGSCFEKLKRSWPTNDAKMVTTLGAVAAQITRAILMTLQMKYQNERQFLETDHMCSRQALNIRWHCSDNAWAVRKYSY